MALISFSTISDGTTGTASQVNTPLTTIYNDYNGNITDANIAAGAAIAGSKIAVQSIRYPYKFLVYLNGVANVTSSRAVVAFDTKVYDTSTNIDVATNKGRFTAPIAGFYVFSFVLSTSAGGSANHYIDGYLYKNGVAVVRGVPSSTNGGRAGSGLSIPLQLSANDYVEVYGEGDTTLALDPGNTPPFFTWFSGYLLSAT